MKQFSLEEYKKNQNCKVVTRDGNPVRILCTDVKDKYPIVGVADLGDNREDTYTFTQDGAYIEGCEDERDLFFAPEKKIAWANLYCTELGTMFTGEFFKTEEAALKEKVKDLCKYITTFKVQWEE